MNRIEVRRAERGFALVVAMLVLLVLTLLGLIIMSSVVMNRGLVGNDQRLRQSLNIAEAGVGEAISRIRSQETLMDPTDRNDVCQVFNTVAGSVPVLGADSVALATGQTAGSYLNYTAAGKGPDVLTIAWKKDPTGTKVMRYEATHVPIVNVTTGLPIYVVTSTGRVGTARRTVVAEIIQKPFNALMKSGLTANTDIKFTGNAVVCGYNHSADTPEDDGKNGRGTAPDCMDNETAGNDLPGIWTSSTIAFGGGASVTGSPVTNVQSQSGFFAGPWEACGMTQADFLSWIGNPVATPGSLNGITYLDNNATAQDISASVALHNVTGEGLLYVDGDLHVNAGFVYRGLIYTEGDFDVNGHAWILGGVICRGKGTLKSNGGSTILYSSEAINRAIAKYGGQFVTLSWREQ